MDNEDGKGLEALRRNLAARKAEGGDHVRVPEPEAPRRPAGPVPRAAAVSVGIALAAIVLAAAVLWIRSGAGGGEASPDRGGGDVSSVQGTADPAGQDPGGQPAQDGASAMDVTELFDLLREDVGAAEAYKDRSVELSGYLINFDPDRKSAFVGAEPGTWEYSLDSVCCGIADDGLLERAAGIGIGSPVVVRGLVTDVGEVMGYAMVLEDIEAG